MKYPKEQFKLLVYALSSLKIYVDLTSIHPCMLHGIIYNQYAESGQDHNKLLVDDSGKLIRSAALVGDQLAWNEGTRLIASNPDFELYPAGCHDSHVETAVKRALAIVSV